MTAPAKSKETMVALVPRALLGDVLTAVHAAGLGRQASVVDPQRGDVEGRLRRLGVDEIGEIPRTDVDSVLVIVPAPGRIGPTEILLRDKGAIALAQCGRLPAREHAWFGALFGGVDSSDSAAG
jgi:hypothetical protein